MTEDDSKDSAGRVMRECEEGLTFTQASMSRFMMFCVLHNVQIIDTFYRPEALGNLVIVLIRIRPDKIDTFEREVKAKLRLPTKADTGIVL